MAFAKKRAKHGIIANPDINQPNGESMPVINDKSLITLNSSGLIPGPLESAEAFSKRVDYCLQLCSLLPEEIKMALSDNGQPNRDVMQQAIKRLGALYDCAPEWIPLFFTNHQLPFWQGGCAWIFQMEETTPTAALIQLRKNFAANKKYLGLYDRDELLTHELCHAGRMMFHEPKFEEIIAYNSSGAPSRRIFGSLVQSSMESALFLLLLFVIVVFDVFLIATGRTDAYTISLWLRALPILLLGGAVARLWMRKRTYKACLDNLSKAAGKMQAAHIAYRLTDGEIESFAKSTPESIREYAASQKETELRWQVIWNAYFQPGG